MRLTSTFLKKAVMTTAIFSLALYGYAQADFETDGFGRVVIEAEDYSGLENTSPGSTWELDTIPAGYSANGAMRAAPSDGGPFASAEDAMNGSAYLSYSIDFSAAGIYYVWARSNRTGGSDDSYHVGLNGEILEGGTFINFENSVGLNPEESDSAQWVWINHSGQVGGPAFVDVPSEGIHNLDIYIRESDFKIDLIVLSPDISFEPNDEDFVSEPTEPTSIISVQNNNDLALRNYPSPFTDQTTVSFSLLTAGHISIKAYSIDGSEVATLYNGYKAAGQSTFTWAPGNNVPQGIYFIQLQTGSGSQSIKTIKLR